MNAITRENRSYWGVIYHDYVKEPKLFGCTTFKNFSQVVAQEMIYTTGEIENSAYSLNERLADQGEIRYHPASLGSHSEVVIAHDHMEPRIEKNGNDMLYANESGKNFAHYR